jgi:hypothetical protein
MPEESTPKSVVSNNLPESPVSPHNDHGEEKKTENSSQFQAKMRRVSSKRLERVLFSIEQGDDSKKWSR